MIHGKLHCRAALLLVCCIGLVLSGCRLSRQAAQTAQVRESFYYNDSLFVDYKLQQDTTRTERRDTTSTTATESGTILIQRDSIGRPQRIEWAVTKSLQGVSLKDTRTESVVYSLDAEQRSELTDSVDSVTEKTEEVAQTVSPVLPLEDIIGPALLGLVLLYLLYLFFADVLWPWIKKQRNR